MLPSIPSSALSVGLLLCSSLVGPAAAYYSVDIHNEQLHPASTVTPLLRQMPPVNLRFQRRQNAAICPTGTTSCGSNCCAQNTNCWNNASCAPLGQCPSASPVQCHDNDADPNGENANLFYCCPTGYFCSPKGQTNNCILSQTSTAPADTPTVTVAIRTIITIAKAALVTTTPSMTGSDAEAIATQTTSSSTKPSLSTTTALPTKKLPIGPIVGGAVGGVVVVGILAAVLFCWLKRRKPSPPQAEVAYNPKTATISSYGSPNAGFQSPGFQSPLPQPIVIASPQQVFEERGAPSPNPYINRPFNYASMPSPAELGGSPRSPGFSVGTPHTPGFQAVGTPRTAGFNQVGGTPMGSPRSPGFQISSTPLGSPRSPGFQISATPLGSPRSPGFQISATPLGSPRSPTFQSPPGSPRFPPGGTGPLPLGTQVQASGSSPNLPFAPYNPQDWASPSAAAPAPSSPPPTNAIVLSLPSRSASSPPDSPMTYGPPPAMDEEVSPPAWSPPPPPTLPPPRPLVLPVRSETPGQGIIAPVPVPVPFSLPDAPALRDGRPSSYHENEVAPRPGTPQPNNDIIDTADRAELESYYASPPTWI